MVLEKGTNPTLPITTYDSGIKLFMRKVGCVQYVIEMIRKSFIIKNNDNDNDN